MLNRCSGDLWVTNYVFLPTCPKQCTKDPLLCSRLWDEFQDLLIYAFVGIGFPSWTSPAPTLHSYLDSAIVTCQPPEHDGTQGLPRYDCCSFPSQFFLTLDPVPRSSHQGRVSVAFIPRFLWGFWSGQGNHTSSPGALAKHPLSFPGISYQSFELYLWLMKGPKMCTHLRDWHGTVRWASVFFWGTGWDSFAKSKQDSLPWARGREIHCLTLQTCSICHEPVRNLPEFPLLSKGRHRGRAERATWY